MAHTTDALGDKALEFLSEYHLATLTTLRAGGTPHVVAVGFTWDPGTRLARVITFEGSQKTLNVDRGGYAVVSQVDGGRWLTMEGPARVARDRDAVVEGERRYAARYREPKVNPRRVVIEISVERVMGSVLDRS